jgi:two-component system chemotaxis response regulator CheY
VKAAGKTALVVDDDPEIRKIIAIYLKRMGFAVTQAGDGRAAIRQLDDARPDLLCIDLVLPESSGYDVCEHILHSEGLKGLRILMISARTLPADQAMAEELGVHDYLIKPFSQADFIAHVNRVLEGTSPP